MNERDEKLILERLRESLNEDLSNLDPEINQKLTQARAKALADTNARPFHVSRILPRLGPVLVFACSVLVVVGIFRLQSETPLDFMPSEPDYAILFDDVTDIAAHEVELIEELEFFEWLEAEGHAG